MWGSWPAIPAIRISQYPPLNYWSSPNRGQPCHSSISVGIFYNCLVFAHCIEMVNVFKLMINNEILENYFYGKLFA
jgi:hypothetical protein